MPRRLAVATAALALSLGGAAAAQAAPIPVPGPKVPVEHLGFSGAQFNVRSGTPRCFTGGGSMGLGYPIPAGATVTGLTAYVIDGQTPGLIHVELSRHDFATGASHILATGDSVNGDNTTVELKVAGGHTVAIGEGVNVVVTLASGTCFKGATMHYLAPGVSATADGSAQRRRAEPGLAPDGSTR